MSLKEVPSNILNFFERYNCWQSLNGLPAKLLTLESMLAKYELFNKIISSVIEERYAYINTPKAIWTNEDDRYLLQQRETSNFFSLKYEESNPQGFTIVSKTSKLPWYSYICEDLKNDINTLNKNIEKAIKNLDKVNTMYSTHFGFDTLIITIIALIVAILAIVVSH